MSTEKENESQQESSERQVPLVEEDFTDLLKQYRLKPALCTNIAHNIAMAGGEGVFEDPHRLYERLIAWSGDIGPQNRRHILEEWFSTKSIEVPPDLLKKAAMTDTARKEAEDKDQEGSEVRYVFDEGHGVVRMAKTGEKGGTLAEAQKLKEMADGAGGESPFIPGEDGKLILNPKARITGVELLAFQSIQKLQAAGKDVDPMDELAAAAEKVKMYREVMGVGGGGAPWMSDPVEFFTRMKSVSGGDEATAALRTELAEARKLIQDMKDEQLRGTIEAQQTQIRSLTDKLGQVLDQIDNIKKGAVGRTEMDILHSVVTEGMGFVKQELPAFRKDVKDGLTGMRMGGNLSPEQREERKQAYRQSLQADKEIEDIGRRLFTE
jgi:hypothetical protein